MSIENEFWKRQDVQFHTTFSDGKDGIEEMIKSAINSGVRSLIITDHACGWQNSDGSLDEFFNSSDEYQKYLSLIDFMKKKYANEIKLFSGLEIEVGINGEFKLADGIRSTPTVSSETKFGVDIILGAIHSESFEEDCIKFGIAQNDRRSILIQNMIAVVKNKLVDVFAHPFQAIHGQFSDNLMQDESKAVLNALLKEWASGHQIYFEINGKKWPSYEQWAYNKYESGEMETNDKVFLKFYKDHGGQFVFGSDAHSTTGFDRTDFSIADSLELTEDDQHVFV